MTALLWMPMVCLIGYALTVTAYHSYRASKSHRPPTSWYVDSRVKARDPR